MTKKERDYLIKLVVDTNNKALDIVNGELYSFLDPTQLIGYIQGLSNTVEPIAELLGLEPITVNTTKLEQKANSAKSNNEPYRRDNKRIRMVSGL